MTQQFVAVVVFYNGTAKTYNVTANTGAEVRRKLWSRHQDAKKIVVVIK